MKPPKNTQKPSKVRTTKRSDGAQQWESQSFRAAVAAGKSTLPSGALTPLAKSMGKARASAFSHTTSKRDAVKVQARAAQKKGRKHGAGK